MPEWVEVPVIDVGGAPLSALWADTLVGLRIERTAGTAAHASLKFGYAQFDDRVHADLAMGTELEISVFEGAAPLFKGTILSRSAEVSRGGRLGYSFEAFDASYKLGQASIHRSYNDTTIASVVSDIVSEHGLTGDVNVGDTATYPIVHVAGTVRQVLDRLARDYGCEWYVDDATLVFKERVAGSAGIELKYGENLISIRARESTADTNQSVRVLGWDPAVKEPVTATKSRDSSSPASYLAASPVVLRSATQATAMADGLASRLDSARTSIRGEVRVMPELVPGSFINIANIPEWDATVLHEVTSVVHEFGSGRGFFTRFTVGALDPGGLVDLTGGSSTDALERVTTGVTIGIVTDTADPDGYSRVKVKFPYLDDTVSGWARLVLPGAGASRGLHVIPEIDDEVVVLFEHGDLRYPYVLGGLWNGVDSAPKDNTAAEVIDGGDVMTRSFTSRLGHEVVFSDGAEPATSFVSVTLDDTTTKLFLGREKIELLTPDALPLKLATKDASIEFNDDGEITIKGKKVTIEATETDVALKASGGNGNVTVDGQNITVSASRNLALKGTAGVKIESPATTEIKGMQVKVN